MIELTRLTARTADEFAVRCVPADSERTDRVDFSCVRAGERVWAIDARDPWGHSDELSAAALRIERGPHAFPFLMAPSEVLGVMVAGDFWFRNRPANKLRNVTNNK